MHKDIKIIFPKITTKLKSFQITMKPKSLTIVMLTLLVPLVTSTIDDNFEENEEVIQDIPNLLTSNQTLNKSPGEDLSLFCQYNSYRADIPVLWHFNSKMYSAGETKLYNQREFSVKITQGQGEGVRLVVPNLTQNDSGLYTCKLGAQHSKSATFNVQVSSASSSVILNVIPMITFCALFAVFGLNA